MVFQTNRDEHDDVDLYCCIINRTRVTVFVWITMHSDKTRESKT